MALSRRLLAVLVTLGLATGCALPHGATGGPDAAPVEDHPIAVDATRDTIASDVPEPTDTPAVDEGRDVMTAVDVQPDVVMVRDVPPPMDVQPDIPPPVDVQPDIPPPPPDTGPTLTPAGGVCSSSAMCASGTQCFGFIMDMRCADCGHYGERPCAGGVCTEGVANGGTCIRPNPYDTGNVGQPGGGCARDSDCGTPGQCWYISRTTAVCLACGGVGQGCCCNTTSCSCNGARCELGPPGGWTICY